MLQNLSAIIVCLSPKVWDFDEIRLHQASVVREYIHKNMDNAFRSNSPVSFTAYSGGKSGAFPSFATEASELCFKVLLSTILFFLEVTTVAKIVSCDYSPSTRPSLYCRRLKVLSQVVYIFSSFGLLDHVIYLKLRKKIIVC